MKRFVFNDENEINSYGFRVLTDGIALEQFQNNPICLNNHINDTKNVLGTWKDLKAEKGLLSGVPQFDTNDDEGKEVVRKVEAGTIKSCSMGIRFNKKHLQVVDGVLTLTKCVLFEVSIVAVPSNAKALVLYNQDGELVPESEIKELCLNLKPNSIKMKQVITHLQLQENADETAVLSAVKNIEAKLTASENEKAELKAENDALKKANEEREQKELNTLLDNSIKTGIINANQKENFLKLGLDTAKSIIENLPKREKIADQLNTEESQLKEFDTMSWEELDKANKLPELKLNHPEYFKERYKKEFNQEYKD